MASSTSPLFLIDGATLGSANARFLANFRRKMSIQNLNFRYQRNPKSAGDNLGRCFLEVRRTAGCSWRMLRLRSARNGFAEGGGYEESSEDAIQETIEKSKKVLALQKEILQKIAERRKLLHSVKNSIVDPVNGETFNESVGTMGQSITSAPSAGSKGDLSDSQAFDEEHSTASFPSVSSKHSSNSTSGSSASSGNLRRKDFRPERVLVDMDSSDTEDIPRSSAEFSGNHSYSENGMDSVKKTEGMSDTPAFLSNRASALLYDKTSQVKEVTSDMSDLTLSKASPVEEVSNDMNEPTPLAGNNVMNIVLVAAECAPWSKTGGLGDVIAALPKALARRGHRVMVVVPRYDDYPEAQNTGVLKRYKVAGQDFEVSYYHAYIDGVDFVFIDCALFRGIGKNIYGGNRQDILRRMVLFCKAAIEVPWHVPCGGVCYGDGNLAFIANDWHTALLPVYLKAYYHDNGLMIYARSVLVIHNIAHQGRGPLAEFSYVDLPAQYLDSFRLYDPVGGEHLNIFAAGLKAAHRIVTVSHGYAWELKTQEGGWGLHNIINESDWKLRGIVNGIDTKEWSPESDVYLQSDGYVNYSLETLNVGKLQCKVALQRELGLPVKKEVPLIGFIGRLDHQKGVDIIGESIPWMMEQDVQLVMLGTGRPDLEQMLKQFQSEHHDRVRGWVGFSVKTAHRITAGADILLMPSRFEPCGLNQLYAMRYGTVPVVHAVGGLKDTVEPFDPFNDSGYGWTFHTADSEKLKEALWNCLLTFREYRQSFEALQRRGMMRNLSWDRAAEMYEEEVVAAKYQW